MRLLLFKIFVITNSISAQPSNHGLKVDLDNLYPDSNLFIPHRAEWQITAYKNRIKDFKNDPIGDRKIVFLGNSIVEGCKDWNKIFGLKNIVNRGITGDVTASMLARLNEIYYYKPSKVFLLIGINDIFDGVIPYDKEATPTRIVNNIYKIAENIKFNSAKTEIFIHTLLPINEEKFRKVRGFYPTHNNPINAQINEINRKIINSGKDKEYQIIDLHSIFINDKGKMELEFFRDGLHLNDAGYKAWTAHIKKFVKE